MVSIIGFLNPVVGSAEDATSNVVNCAQSFTQNSPQSPVASQNTITERATLDAKEVSSELWDELYLIQQLFPVPKGFFGRSKDRQISTKFRVVSGSFSQRLGGLEQFRPNKKRVLEFYRPSWTTIGELFKNEATSRLFELFPLLGIDSIKILSVAGSVPLSIEVVPYLKSVQKTGERTTSKVFWLVKSDSREVPSAIFLQTQDISRFLLEIQLLKSSPSIARATELLSQILNVPQINIQRFLTPLETIQWLSIYGVKVEQLTVGSAPNLLYDPLSDNPSGRTDWLRTKLKILFQFLDSEFQKPQGASRVSALLNFMRNPYLLGQASTASPRASVESTLDQQTKNQLLSRWTDYFSTKQKDGFSLTSRWQQFESALNQEQFYIVNGKVVDKLRGAPK